MECEFGYAYILPSLNGDDFERTFHIIKTASELCLAHDIQFSLHLGYYDPKHSAEWWDNFMRCFDTIPITNIIINLDRSTGDSSEVLNTLPQRVKDVLKLENDVSAFSLSDVINFSEKAGIPIIINLHNDKIFSSTPLQESIDRISKLHLSDDLDFVVSEIEESISDLRHKVEHLKKRINIIVASTEYNVSILRIIEYMEHERLRADFLDMVDSKLRKSEKEVWFNPDHDHMDKHLKG